MKHCFVSSNKTIEVLFQGGQGGDEDAAPEPGTGGTPHPPSYGLDHTSAPRHSRIHRPYFIHKVPSETSTARNTRFGLNDARTLAIWSRGTAARGLWGNSAETKGIG